MKKLSLGALVAAGLLMGGLGAGSASAADLGGNCCADLEERIAELEATTARKGNRKVSLTISGWVAEQILWWDDGKQSGTYVGGIGTTLASHVTFSGQATIMPGWYAGYVLTAEFDEHDPLLNHQQQWNNAAINTDGLSGISVFPGVNVLNSYWFVKSDHLGKVSVGQQSAAADNAAILVDGSGSLVPANWVQFDNANFFIRNKFTGELTGVKWGGLGYCFTSGENIGGDCQAVPTNVVRYDSPVFAGFSMSADWGQNGGYWDVYARYAGEYNGIKIAATSGYGQTNTASVIQTSPVFFDTAREPQFQENSPCNLSFEGKIDDDQNHFCRVGYWQSGIYLEHVATGLFVYGAYGREFLSDVSPGFDSEPDHWMVKGGLRERWTSLGHSVLYGFYAQRNNMFNGAGAFGVNGAAGSNGILGAVSNECQGEGSDECVVKRSETREWGGGVVQEIDAAAMSVWVQAEHFDASVSGCQETPNADGSCPFAGKGPNEAQIVKGSLEGMTIVKFGGLINF